MWCKITPFVSMVENYTKEEKMKKSKRISISFPQDIADQLEDLAALTHESLNAIVVEKVKTALDLDEDAYWIKIAQERIAASEGKPTISLEDAWKDIKSK